MKTRLPIRLSVPALVAGILLLSNRSALACAACYNSNTGSKMGNAANWGIIAMVIIMFFMLSAVVAFGFYLAWRAKNPLPDYSELLEETEIQPKPSTP